jgi:hypothetical protein
MGPFPKTLVAVVLCCLAGCGANRDVVPDAGGGDGGGVPDAGGADAGEGDRGDGGQAAPDGVGIDTALDLATDVPVDAGGEPGDAGTADAPMNDAEPCWRPGGCPCGKTGQPCCAGPPSAGCSEPGTTCTEGGPVGSTCVKCGEPGGPCCAGNACSNGGCCVLQQVAGRDHYLCTGSGAACPLVAPATCGSSPVTPASCGTCGSAGQPCCAVAGDRHVCTAPRTYCRANSAGAICEACGAEGQPCCPHDGSIGTGFGGAGVCNPGLFCPEKLAATCQVLPIGCDDGSCPAGTRCDAWAGRCEPASTTPPPGRDNGEPCSADADCRSATGVGAPLVPACTRLDGRWEGGYCLSYCNEPRGGFWTNPLSRSNCPAGSVCLPVFQHPAGEPYGGCVRECRSDSDCRVAEGYYCRRKFTSLGPTFSNGYCAPLHCRSRGCASLKCGC